MITYVTWDTWLVNNNLYPITYTPYLVTLSQFQYQGFSIVTTPKGLRKLDAGDLVINNDTNPLSLFDDLVLNGYAELWLHFNQSSYKGLLSLIDYNFYDPDGNKHIVLITNSLILS